MQAIVTQVVKTKGQHKYTLIATTASGKKATRHIAFPPATEKQHRDTATDLSTRMGWGSNLVGGETKEGFAYVPVQMQPMTVESAGNLLAQVAAKCPGTYAPTTVAEGIAKIIESSKR